MWKFSINGTHCNNNTLYNGARARESAANSKCKEEEKTNPWCFKIRFVGLANEKFPHAPNNWIYKKTFAIQKPFYNICSRCDDIKINHANLTRKRAAKCLVCLLFSHWLNFAFFSLCVNCFNFCCFLVCVFFFVFVSFQFIWSKESVSKWKIAAMSKSKLHNLLVWSCSFEMFEDQARPMWRFWAIHTHNKWKRRQETNTKMSNNKKMKEMRLKIFIFLVDIKWFRFCAHWLQALPSN